MVCVSIQGASFLETRAMSRLTAMIAAAILLATPSLAQDSREPAVRTDAERDFILGQMRLFLGSTQAIATALATDDVKTVAAEATARGRKVRRCRRSRRG